MFDLQRMLESLRELPALQRAMQGILADAERITAEGEAGGGLVRARANGRLVLTDLQIEEELLRQPERELLEELILAACNQALDRVRTLLSQKTLTGFSTLFNPFAPGEPEEEKTSEES